MVPPYLPLSKGEAWINGGCGKKPAKKEKEKKEKKQSDFDWQEFSGNFMAQVTSLLTAIVLATQLQ